MTVKPTKLKIVLERTTGKKIAPANPSPRATASQPNGNVLVLGDDGLFHVVDRAMWQAAPVVDTNDPSYPILTELAENGVFLADLPDGIGAGIGEFCTFVNVQAIIKPSSSGGSRA
jgi:hypothetical protein